MNFTLSFQNIPKWKYQFYENIMLQQQIMESISLGQKVDLQQYIVTILSENNRYMLMITWLVSILHNIFEWLAFKSDLQFWNQEREIRGLSVKTLWWCIAQRVVILFYLMDNQTSWLVVGQISVSIVFELWKVCKASKVTYTDQFPWVKIADAKYYVENGIQKYDQIATNYLKKVAYPLIFYYTYYSFTYRDHKGYYSFLLNTLVGCIYTFGFINMTP